MTQFCFRAKEKMEQKKADREKTDKEVIIAAHD
jgi:hypothetical protein